VEVHVGGPGTAEAGVGLYLFGGDEARAARFEASVRDSLTEYLRSVSVRVREEGGESLSSCEYGVGAFFYGRPVDGNPSDYVFMIEVVVTELPESADEEEVAGCMREWRLQPIGVAAEECLERELGADAVEALRVLVPDVE
jgi:hypothetical protein